MIGSIMAWHLNNKLGRQDLVIVDRITHENQWQNLVHRHYAEYLDKDQLFEFLEENDGITAVIQPGGSVKDDEVVAACDRLDLAMVLTGVRHFRH